MKCLVIPLLALVLLAAPLASLLAGEKTHIVRGRVTEMRPVERELTVAPRKGEPVKLKVEDASKLEDRDGAIKLDRVEEGQRVRVRYETRDGVNRVIALNAVVPLLERAQRFFEGAKEYTYSQREEFKRRLDAAVREIDERIADLEDRAEEASIEARRQLQDDIQSLRQKRRDLRERVDRIGAATADTWEEIQRGARDVAEDVERTIERIRRRTADEPKR